MGQPKIGSGGKKTEGRGIFDVHKRFKLRPQALAISDHTDFFTLMMFTDLYCARKFVFHFCCWLLTVIARAKGESLNSPK